MTVIKFPAGVRPALKHLAGQHDQSTHGIRQHPALADLPLPIGKTPIPDGYRRMYHQTYVGNVDSIRENGLLFDKGRGLEGPKGVWLSDKPFYGEGNPSMAIVEVALAKKYGNQSIINTGDIPPSKILAIHEPWHEFVRSYVQDPDILQRIMSGEFDDMTFNLDDANESQVYKAITHIKAATKTRFGKHLAGQHDQSSHGHKGVGPIVPSMTIDETVDFLLSQNIQADDPHTFWRKAFQAVAQKTGRDGKPTVKKFDGTESNVMYRTFDPTSTYTREQGSVGGKVETKIDLFLHGDTPYISDGQLGFGTYTAPTVGTAKIWSQSWSTGEPHLLTLSTDSSAKLVSQLNGSPWKEMSRKVESAYFSSDDESVVGRLKTNPVWREMLYTPTRMGRLPKKTLTNLLTFASGVDGLLPDGDLGEKEFLIWNQKALFVDKKSLPTSMRKHLDGQHDQSSHGHRGGGLSTEQVLTVLDGVKFTDDRKQNWRIAHQAVMEAAGKNGKPAVVDHIDEADAFYRGFSGSETDSNASEKNVQRFIHGNESYVGGGAQGIGTYFTSELTEAKTYATRADGARGETTFGQVVKAGWKSDARLLRQADYDVERSKVGKQVQQWMNTTRLSSEPIPAHGNRAIIAGLKRQDFQNLVLMAQGFDGVFGIDSGGVSHTLVWNRGALNVEVPPAVVKFVSVRFPAGTKPLLKHLAGQHDQSTHGRHGVSSKYSPATQAFLDFDAELESRGFDNATEEERQKVGGLYSAAVEEVMDKKGFTNQSDAERYVSGLELHQRLASSTEVDNLPAAIELADNVTRFVDSADVVVAVDDAAMQSILQDGRFKNQFETKTSNGLYAPEKRTIQEAITHGAAWDMPAQDRPIYGYLSKPDELFGFEEEDNVAHYGAFRVVLKPAVRDRTSFTIGDSLGWEAIAAPLSSKNSPTRLINAAGNPIIQERLALGPKSAVDWTRRTSYFEAQIHGRVTVSDIARVHIPQRRLKYNGVEDKTAFNNRLSLIDRLRQQGIEVVVEPDFPVAKHLAGQHDQSSHGRHGNITTSNAGNGYSAKQVVYAQKGVRDFQVNQVYGAQRSIEGQGTTDARPVGPKLADFASYDEYSKAFDEYKDAHDKWAAKQVTHVVSDTGKKHLDGSRKGVVDYVDEVTHADWFVEQFGDGRNLPPMKISVVASRGNWSGQHQVGVRANGQAIHNLKIDKNYSQAESTILHEIAHYATAISATGSWAGHGPEFARNYLSLVDKVMGPEQAELLRISYTDQGVKF